MASTTAEATESSLEIELTKKSTRKDGTRNSEGKKRRRVNTIYLWEFLLDLLANDDLRTIICWSRREFKEFKLKRPEEVSRRWGLVKRKKGMNYEKLSRALRFFMAKESFKRFLANLSRTSSTGYLTNMSQESQSQVIKKAKRVHPTENKRKFHLISLHYIKLDNPHSRLHLSSQHFLLPRLPGGDVHPPVW